MFDKDPNQKLRTPKYGQQITGAVLEKIRALILQTVKGGRGIQVQRVGQSVIVSVEEGARGGGGGGGGTPMYEATTKAGLPNTDISQTAFGRVTAGADKGMMCIRNVDNDDWDSFNFWE